MKPKTLSETVEMMNSSDYKDRFKAEFWQVKIRKDKLEKIIRDAGKMQLDFTPDCTINTLRKQKNIMKSYLGILRIRASIEGIDLEEDDHEQA